MNLALIQTTAGTVGRGLKIETFVFLQNSECVLCAQSCPTLCNPMTIAPPGSCVWDFSRQEYWSGLPFPTPGDLPDPGIKPPSLALPALAGRFFSTSTTWEAHISLQEPKLWLYSVVSKERNTLGLPWWH